MTCLGHDADRVEDDLAGALDDRVLDGEAVYADERDGLLAVVEDGGSGLQLVVNALRGALAHPARDLHPVAGGDVG
jgi:hypothetical protein